MNCPRCNTSGCYVGLNTIECTNLNCVHWKPHQEPMARKLAWDICDFPAIRRPLKVFEACFPLRNRIFSYYPGDHNALGIYEMSTASGIRQEKSCPFYKYASQFPGKWSEYGWFERFGMSVEDTNKVFNYYISTIGEEPQVRP